MDFKRYFGKIQNKIKEEKPDVVEEEKSDVIEEEKPDVIEEEKPDVIEEEKPDVGKTLDFVDVKKEP